MHTVGLIVVLALLALQAGVQLGTQAYALPGLDQRHLGADTHGFANDLVANGQREVLVSPAAADGVYIGTADAAGLDLDLDVEIFEGLGDDLEEQLTRLFFAPAFFQFQTQLIPGSNMRVGGRLTSLLWKVVHVSGESTW
jgi:hypothetical protein